MQLPCQSVWKRLSALNDFFPTTFNINKIYIHIFFRPLRLIQNNNNTIERERRKNVSRWWLVAGDGWMVKAILLYESTIKWIVNNFKCVFDYWHVFSFTLSIIKTNLFSFSFLFSLQYYEMSYGLNVEMHKQVRNFNFLNYLISDDVSILRKTLNLKLFFHPKNANGGSKARKTRKKNKFS